MSEALEHSKLGLISVLIGGGTWLYVFIIVLLYHYTNFIKIAFPQKGDFFDQLPGFFIFLFMYLFVPFAGFLLGLILAGVASIRKSKKRLFGVIGLFLNVLPFILTAVYLFFF